MSALRFAHFRGSRSGSGGFTLIEVIITLVLMGIAASMMTTLFSNAFTNSSQPLRTLGQDVNLSLVMEGMINAYESKADPTTGAITTADLDALKGEIGAEGDTADKYGGPYKVIDNHYVEYDASGAEQDRGSTQTSILKVTIQSTSGDNKQTLTYLFTARDAS